MILCLGCGSATPETESTCRICGKPLSESSRFTQAETAGASGGQPTGWSTIGEASSPFAAAGVLSSDADAALASIEEVRAESAPPAAPTSAPTRATTSAATSAEGQSAEPPAATWGMDHAPNVDGATVTGFQRAAPPAPPTPVTPPGSTAAQDEPSLAAFAKADPSSLISAQDLPAWIRKIAEDDAAKEQAIAAQRAAEQEAAARAATAVASSFNADEAATATPTGATWLQRTDRGPSTDPSVWGAPARSTGPLPNQPPISTASSPTPSVSAPSVAEMPNVAPSLMPVAASAHEGASGNNRMRLLLVAAVLVMVLALAALVLV